jgi:hypothetical protein
MIAIAVLFVCVLCDCFKLRRRLEAEIRYCGVLRYQLNVLQERAQRQLCDNLAIHLEALARRCSPALVRNRKEKPSLKG